MSETTTHLASALDAWRTLLGGENVLHGQDASNAWGADTTGAVRRLPAALRIRDSRLLPDVMRIAQQHRIPVHPVSTGKNWGYGTALAARDDCVLIDLSALRAILHFDPEMGVVTLE